MHPTWLKIGTIPRGCLNLSGQENRSHLVDPFLRYSNIFLAHSCRNKGVLLFFLSKLRQGSDYSCKGLKIAQNARITHGLFIATSARSRFIRENVLLIPGSLSLVSWVEKVGRPLLPVWMQSTEICMRTEGDHRRSLCHRLSFSTNCSRRLTNLFTASENSNMFWAVSRLMPFLSLRINSISHSKLSFVCSIRSFNYIKVMRQFGEIL